MVMSRFVVASAAAVLGVSSVASADFFIDQPVTVIGAAGPQFGGTSWGTNIAGGTTHLLGTSTTYPDAGFPAFFVVVTSVVNNINSLTITLDFSNFGPGDFDFHAVDITGLKQDGSIIGVTASQGIAQIFDNAHAVVDAVLKARPASLKGTYVRSCTLSSTMSPGLKVDPRSLDV